MVHYTTCIGSPPQISESRPQSSVHKDKRLVWCGGSWLVCTEPWPLLEGQIIPETHPTKLSQYFWQLSVISTVAFLLVLLAKTENSKSLIYVQKVTNAASPVSHPSFDTDCFPWDNVVSALGDIIRSLVSMAVPSSTILFHPLSFWQENTIQLFCCTNWRKKGLWSPSNSQLPPCPRR